MVIVALGIPVDIGVKVLECCFLPYFSQALGQEKGLVYIGGEWW
jgi:hypothetical protein